MLPYARQFEHAPNLKDGFTPGRLDNPQQTEMALRPVVPNQALAQHGAFRGRWLTARTRNRSEVRSVKKTSLFY